MTGGQRCGWDGCDRDPVCRGLCGPHYRRRLHTGRFGYRDAGPVREHLEKLRGLGWTWQAIGDKAGVSPWVAHNVHLGRTRRVLADSEGKLLALPLVPYESHRGVDSTGSRRRVQALAWMGWPNHAVADRIGCSRRSLPTLLARGSISARLALRITVLYDQLSTIPGPSKLAAVKARQHGFASPWAWDDETIDDPAARPTGLRKGRAA